MRKQVAQVVENTITEGVSVIRSDNKTALQDSGTDKLRVAAYCRVSKNIAEQLSSINTQMDTYHRLISEHPEWELVEIYSDKGKTGTNTKKRTAFMKMINDAEDGKIDLILVKSISRFCRNTVDMLETIRYLKKLGVEVFFEKEKLNTANLNSELLLTVFAAFAQEESYSISENMRKGIRQRFKLGIPKVSKVYGYDNLKRGVLSINDEQSVIVKRIFDLYIDGYSTIEIADILNKDEIVPPLASSRKWYSASVKCIIQNEKYIGDSLMQKYYTSNHLEHDSTPNKDLKVEQYYKENTHPSIIDRDVYMDANRIMMMRDLKRGPNIYPYYGRLICPYCSKPMVKINTGIGKLPSVWVCGGEDKGEYYKERTECPLYYIKEPYLSVSVIEAFKLIDIDTASIEFGLLRKYVKYISFTADFSNLIVVWYSGKETVVPYNVERISDFPVQTIINNHIGPFKLTAYQRAVTEDKNRRIKEVIYNTRIIRDNSHRFPCPPLII